MSRKIARITADKKLLLSNEIIEGDKISLNADGTLYVNEVIEGDKFSINSNGIEVTELIEDCSFGNILDFGEILEGKIDIGGVTSDGARSSVVANIPVDLFPLYYDGWHELYDYEPPIDVSFPSLYIRYDTEQSPYGFHRFISYNNDGSMNEDRLFEYDNSYNYRIVIGNVFPQQRMGVRGEFILRRGSETGEILYKQYYDVTVGKEGGGCYLTTAMVGYFNKADDGIELTAMRELRSHSGYKYKDVLEEYAQISPIIIRGIEQSENKDYYYNMIKDVVDNIVIWVADKEWGKAETAYLNLYYELKEKFGGV